MKRLLVIRHGESIWNAEGRWQGWANIPLSAAGEQQAKAAGERLATLRFHAVYSSGLSRAHQTAEIISSYVECSPVTPIVGLRERNVGEFQGMLATEIQERWPHVAAAWAKGVPIDPPGGEVAAEFESRVLAAIHEVLSRADDDSTLLAVSHGGVVRALETHLGVRTERIHNLAGRWVHAENGRLMPGEAFCLEG